MRCPRLFSLYLYRACYSQMKCCSPAIDSSLLNRLQHGSGGTTYGLDIFSCSSFNVYWNLRVIAPPVLTLRSCTVCLPTEEPTESYPPVAPEEPTSRPKTTHLTRPVQQPIVRVPAKTTRTCSIKMFKFCARLPLVLYYIGEEPRAGSLGSTL